MTPDQAVGIVTSAARDAVDALTAGHAAEVTALRTEIAALKAELGPRVIKHIDFDDLPVGAFTGAMCAAKFGTDDTTGMHRYLAERGWRIIQEGNHRVLEGRLRANSLEQSVWFAPLEPTEHATITTVIKLVDGFVHGKGYKLPCGLGGTSTTANPPTGGAASDHGFTLTPMGRTGGEAKTRPAGTAVTYVYAPSKVEAYGRYEFPEVVPPIGRYFERVDEIALNTPGQADGILRTTIDGNGSLDRRDYIWRTDPAVTINRLRWALFRGGNTSDWQVPVDNYVRVRSVTVTTPR